MEKIEDDDAAASFYQSLQKRYGRSYVIPDAPVRVIVTIRPRYACPKGRAGVVQAKAPAHLLEGSWPTEALLAHIAVAKHSEHMPLNRQSRVMARHGVPIDRSVLADWMGRTGALWGGDHTGTVAPAGYSGGHELGGPSEELR